MVLRAVILTVLLRLAIGGLMRAVPDGGAGAPAPAARLLLVAVVVVLCAIDGRAAHEPVFHANLGTGARVTLGVSAVTALLAESALGGLLGLAGW